MASSRERVCWDACAWIALIGKEKIVEAGVDRFTRCNSVLEQAKKGKIEVVTSALSLAEVCKEKDVRASDPANLAAFFEQDYILLVNIDRRVGSRARELMMSGLPGLKPADACHVATAAMTPDVKALHSFDGNLLKLNGKIFKPDGSPLTICFPDVGGAPTPLLD